MVFLLAGACTPPPPDVTAQYHEATDATISCILESDNGGLAVTVDDPYPHPLDPRLLDWTVEAEGTPDMPRDEFIRLHEQLDATIDRCMNEHLEHARELYIEHIGGEDNEEYG